MKIQCTNSTSFELIDDGKQVAHLTYDNFFSFKATAVVGDKHYRFISKGFFGTSIMVTQDEKEIATMTMDWRGNMIFSYLDGQEFKLRPTGIFHNTYVLEDHDKNQILTLHPEFSWRKFRYNFIISYDKKPKDPLLVLLSVYFTNYYISALSSSGM